MARWPLHQAFGWIQSHFRTLGSLRLEELPYENPSLGFAKTAPLFTRGDGHINRVWRSDRCVCIPWSDTIGLQRFFVIYPRDSAGIRVDAQRAFRSQFGRKL